MRMPVANFAKQSGEISACRCKSLVVLDSHANARVNGMTSEMINVDRICIAFRSDVYRDL